MIKSVPKDGEGYLTVTTCMKRHCRNLFVKRDKRKKKRVLGALGLIVFDIFSCLVYFSSKVSLWKTGQSVGLGADEQSEEQGYCKDT